MVSADKVIADITAQIDGERYDEWRVLYMPEFARGRFAAPPEQLRWLVPSFEDGKRMIAHFQNLGMQTVNYPIDYPEAEYRLLVVDERDRPVGDEDMSISWQYAFPGERYDRFVFVTVAKSVPEAVAIVHDWKPDLIFVSPEMPDAVGGIQSFDGILDTPIIVTPIPLHPTRQIRSSPDTLEFVTDHLIWKGTREENLRLDEYLKLRREFDKVVCDRLEMTKAGPHPILVVVEKSTPRVHPL
jgi:hypothetical protein